MTRARQIVSFQEGSDVDDQDSHDDEEQVVYRVQVRQSPYVDTFYQHHSIRITIDSGAPGNMIKAILAKAMNLKVTRTSQSARQADGLSPLTVTGETRMMLSHGSHKLVFEGLVVENLGVDALGGTPFMVQNDLTIRPAKHMIILRDKSVIHYGCGRNGSPPDQHSIRRAHILGAST